MLEFREIKSENEYKLLELNPDAPFTQAWFFGEWQEAMGRKVRRFEIRKDSEIVGFFQAIIYPLVFSKKFIYIPHGPIFTKEPDEKLWEQFKEKITRTIEEENAVFARFDVFPKTENNLGKYFKKTPVHAYRSSYFQPKFEWVLNLEKPEEEILGDMHPKTRYNIGLAERRGVEIEIISENFNKYFDSFYKLLDETAKRDNFNLHPKIYYQNIFSRCDEDKNVFLVVAKYDSKILAINFIFLFGNAAHFMHGGSSDENKNLMFSYLAQWEAIKEAKKRGFKIYNFGAVGEGFEGISRFKKGFGGKLLEYSDSYDIVLNPFWYFLYNLRKKLIYLISN